MIVPSKAVQARLGRAVNAVSAKLMRDRSVYMVGDRYEGGPFVEVVVDARALHRVESSLPSEVDGFPIRVRVGQPAVAQERRQPGLGQAKWVPGQISFAALPPGQTSLPSLQPLVERGLPIAPYIEHGSYVTGEPDIMRYGLDPYRGIMGVGQYEGSDETEFDDDVEYVVLCDNWARLPGSPGNRERGLVAALARAREVAGADYNTDTCRIYEVSLNPGDFYSPGTEAVAVAPAAPEGAAPAGSVTVGGGGGGGGGDVVVTPSAPYMRRVGRWASSGAPSPGAWHSTPAPHGGGGAGAGTAGRVLRGGVRPGPGRATVTGGGSAGTIHRGAVRRGGGTLSPAPDSGSSHRIRTNVGSGASSSGRPLTLVTGGGGEPARLSDSGRRLGLRR